MLNMNSNEIIIDKNSSSIQISNKISSTQRKCYNYMLKIAKNEFQKNKNARIFTISADELMLFFGMGNENHTYLRNELEVLNLTQIKYNILGKNKRSKESGVFTLISEFKYLRGTIHYSFPPTIEQMILNPKMFGKINLVVIKSLRSKYSIALYELAEDYINAQIPKMTILKFKKLMGVEEHQYYKFSTLKKYVIDVAVDEINDRENISFVLSYELNKKGRATTDIKFTIHKKEEVLQLKDRQKKFYGWKKHILQKYKEQTICNNLTEIGYFKWTFFYINQDGLLGKIVDDSRTILDKEEALKVWEYLYQNPSKMTIEPLTQYDILQKDFKNRKIEQVSTTALGTKVTTTLEFIDFKTDSNKEGQFEYFFIEIKQEDDNTVWSRESFSFDDIVAMDFL
jgi:plasmid replication initiation protein